MEEMIAFCGSNCRECGAFIATVNDDDVKRAEVATLWSKQYDADISLNDIYCEGCKSDGGRLFSYCTVCEIRKCAVDKDVINCAYCDDFACETLEQFFHLAPDSKKRLDGIRSAL